MTTSDATLARFREYMVGPSRFMTLLSCFELGLVDRLRDTPGLTAEQLGEAVGAKPDALEQLIFLLVKEGFVAYDDDCGCYSLDALADVAEKDLRQVLADMDMIKVVTLRQLFYLTDSVRAGATVGLNKLYGHEGDLFAALVEHQDLRKSWSRLMDTATAHIDPWFFDNIDIPPGSRVLDLGGNTGLGAIHTYNLKASPGLRVTTFDLPEKEKECLENFRAHDVEDHCSFIGGDVFEGVPKGFDVVLMKHFLPMFDKSKVFRVLEEVNRSLEAGGRINLLVPVFPENADEPGNYTVDFYPSFFLGCVMGQGGPRKLSTWRRWLEECGFTVTKAIAQDPANMPPHTLPVEGILCATKAA